MLLLSLFLLLVVLLLLFVVVVAAVNALSMNHDRFSAEHNEKSENLIIECQMQQCKK